jgi:valyl-tRNA synthetase
MSKSAYNPIAVEAAWYDWWQAEGFFQPRYKPSDISPDGTEVDGGKNQEIRDEGLFVIPAPPPNVTGSLHTGHALAITLQDTLIRWWD